MKFLICYMELKKRLSSIETNIKTHTEKFLFSLLTNPKIQKNKRFTHPIKGLLQHIGSLQFIERTTGFLIFYMIEVLIVKLFVDFGQSPIDLAIALHIPQRAPIFILVAVLVFFIIARYKLLELKKTAPFDFKRFFAFFAINLTILYLFFKLNIFMMQNPKIILENSSLFLSAWYISAFFLTITLFIAFFKKNYILNFIKKFIKPLSASALISLIFLYIYPLLENLWFNLSKLTASSSYILLKFFYPTQLIFSPGNAPTLILPKFRATIAAQCSGIEGITLFIFLFTLLLLIDWNIINKKKAVFLYIIGIIGTIILNILRITTIFLMGQMHSAELAVGFFHSNAGWILFSAYFVIFEFLTYDWLRKNEKK